MGLICAVLTEILTVYWLRNHSATEPYIYFWLLLSQKSINRGVFIVHIAAKEKKLWKKGTTEIEKETSYTT